MYQGRAVRQKVMMARGWRQRKASRQRPLKIAQKNIAPPERMIAAGPLASTASPRKMPNRASASQDFFGLICEFLLRVSPMITAAQTMAMVSIALKGISVAAA